MLYQALVKQARKQPRKPVVIGERRTLTYEQLLRETRQAACYFRRCGLGFGDWLILAIPPCPEFYVLFYAAAAVGMATIPVSASGNLPEQALSLGAVAVAGDKRFFAKVRRNGLQVRQKVIWNRLSGLSIPRSSGRFIRAKAIREQPVLGSFTSGTTGQPTLLFRTAKILYKRAKLGASAWRVSASDVLLSTGPFTSGVNAVYNLVAPILVGCSVAVLEKFDRRKAVIMIATNKVTWIFAVPLIFDILAHLPRDYRPDFSSLKRCSSVGAHLPRSIYDAFHKKFSIRIGQGYGGTDFALAFTVNRTGLPDAVGCRDGLFPVNIVDDKQMPGRVGEIGEIVFDIQRIKDRSARTALETNSKRRGRYIFTGDLGRFDRDGNLYVVGRKSSMIKVGANRVIPEEVENVLRSHPRVREALVIPIRPGSIDEAVGAIVVRNGRVSVETLLYYCAQRLDNYKCPREIAFRKNLSRNRHGKIARHLFSAR
jgi:long-chain acyl-CoA synthetase